MSVQVCDHCRTPIADESTKVERAGQVYCCNNCLQMASGQVQPGSIGPTCGHCQLPIIDSSTQVERNGQTLCCSNCAAASANIRSARIRGYS